MEISRAQYGDFVILGEIARTPNGAILKARHKRSGQTVVRCQ
jgi:hypothetical protein